MSEASVASSHGNRERLETDLDRFRPRQALCRVCCRFRRVRVLDLLPLLLELQEADERKVSVTPARTKADHAQRTKFIASVCFWPDAVALKPT